MTQTIEIPNSESRPFGLLSNSVLLPIKIEDKKHPSVEHYVLSSLLQDPADKALLLSYPTVYEARFIFNQLDHQQYINLIKKACSIFLEKKCRSVAYDNTKTKTIGSLTRQLLKDNTNFVYVVEKNNIPLKTTVGLMNVDQVLIGYDLIGQSLQQMKRIVQKIPDLIENLEHLYWKSHPEHETIIPIKNPKQYRQNPPSKFAQNIIVEEDEDNIYDIHAEYNEGEFDIEEEPEEPAFNPEEKADTNKWVYTNMNSRIDDLRELGARADFLYTKEATATDPFQAQEDLYKTTNPLAIFKIYKVAEHLITLMKNGVDIKQFLNKQIDAILWECRIQPELFGVSTRSLGSKQRHMIYVEYWHKFRSKSIPYYNFIEKELMYPGNIVGFIRKEYAYKLNLYVGQQIKEILFKSFIEKVIERSYPHVDEKFKPLIIHREIKTFSLDEFDSITNELYHLFFQGRFIMDNDRSKSIQFLESQRLTEEEIEEANHFIPLKYVDSPVFNINSTILDPMAPHIKLTIDDKEFNDMFQFIYYKLFSFYGSISKTEAYKLLHKDPHKEGDNLLSGTSPVLQERLNILVENRRSTLVKNAIINKFKTYPQIQELVLYLKATNTNIHFGDINDRNLADLWMNLNVQYKEGTTKCDERNCHNSVRSPSRYCKFHHDLNLMKLVVSLIPNNDLHFEKSVYLYFLIKDFVRSMKLFKSLQGRKLQKNTFNLFVDCFYPKLKAVSGEERCKLRFPTNFKTWLTDTQTIDDNDVKLVWDLLCPLIFEFQQEDFVPSQDFRHIKNKMKNVSDEDLVKVFAKIYRCVYKDEKIISNGDFYILAQMLSGEDNLPTWNDPTYEILREVEDTSNLPPKYHLLSKEIKDVLKLEKRIKNKKSKTELATYHLIHTQMSGLSSLIKESFNRPSIHDPMVSRASYAIAYLKKYIRNPRRIAFFL